MARPVGCIAFVSLWVCLAIVHAKGAVLHDGDIKEGHDVKKVNYVLDKATQIKFGRFYCKCLGRKVTSQRICQMRCGEGSGAAGSFRPLFWCECLKKRMPGWKKCICPSPTPSASSTPTPSLSISPKPTADAPTPAQFRGRGFRCRCLGRNKFVQSKGKCCSRCIRKCKCWSRWKTPRCRAHCRSCAYKR